ncbi:Crp/Fnr family transcriptional regulator [Pelagimonas sp. KU-00592-HH]|jgi:CRP-like cAMP-binding protein|uniref:Crp/Fnr family transcriptional regulator n=1 Tax=Pelagimonas sp. KU-00592-HH TaxID=3127651 RepID=UPI0031038A06
MKIRMADFGQGLPLLEQLSEPIRTCLLSKARVKTFSRGSTISLQDEPADAIKIVQSGWVKLFRVSPSGHEAILATVGAGDSFDEIAALQRGRSPVSAEAVTNCSMLLIDVNCTCGCPGAEREISNAVLSAASGHFDAMMTQIENLKVKSGIERLSEFILELCDKAGGATRVELPYGKVVLAGKLGMKPESLSRAFARLKPVGVRSEVRHVSVDDLRVLRAFVEDNAA